MFDQAVAWIADLGYWAWWSFAILLVILEILSPTFFMLWLGVSAGIIGLLVLLIPSMTWEYQWALFAVISVLSVITARKFLKTNPGVEDNFKLNQRGAQYIGRQFTLIDAIIDGRGKIHVDDSQWAVTGPDMDTGTKVRVTGHDGTLLVVEAVKDPNS